MPTTVMWFRRDLRLSDNPALVEAVRGAGPDGGVVPLFCLDDRLWGPAGDNRRHFLVGCLRALDDDLGGHLIVRRGDPSRVVPELAGAVGATTVFAAGDFGPYGARRDAIVEAALHGDGRRLLRVGSPYAVDPGTVRNRSGEPFKVFTPFARAWRAHG
jgi:deoxyribodipyrimidine photo-lyase